MLGRSAKFKAAISKAVKIGIVLVIIVLIAASGYIALHYTDTTTPSNSTTTSSSTTSTTSASSTIYTSSTSISSSVSYKIPDELVDESPSGPYDSLDPAYGYFTVDGYFASVFQSLVAYNGNNSLQVVPSLASGYTVTSNYENYTFTMRPNTWFSNKDPVNAYVAWFSFVRELYWNAPTTVGISNYADITVNTTTDISSAGNVMPHGLRAALESVGVPNSENAFVSNLNYMLSNFNDTNSTQLKIMSYPNQAYVTINSTTFQINLIQPYSSFLYDLPPQWGAIQDPVYIDAHGGVQNNTGPSTSKVAANFNSNGMPGTGPYMYGGNSSANPSVLVLNANPNYWAANITTGPDQAPHISTVVMKFGLPLNTTMAGFASGDAQIISPPVANLSQAYGEYLSDNPRISFGQLLYNAGFILGDMGFALNTQAYPMNITLLRQAIVHAINYSAVLQQAFSVNGTALGELYLPPSPPGYGPLDNPQNIPLYSYNVTLAQQLANEAGLENNFSLRLPNGALIGNTSAPPLAAIDLVYTISPPSPLSQIEMNLVVQDAAAVGLTLTPVPFCFPCVQTTPPFQNYPVIVGMGWFADWPDPIFQLFYDLATPVAHEPNYVNNSTLNSLLTEIPFETNSTQQLQQTIEAYNIFTQLATIIQMPLQANYFLVQPYVRNLVYSQFQFAILYNMMSFA